MRASVGPTGPHLRIKEARRTSRNGRTRETAKQDAQRNCATILSGAQPTSWSEAVAKRDRAWQHHASNAHHDTHSCARKLQDVCCVMCVLRLWGPPGPTFESRKRRTSQKGRTLKTAKQLDGLQAAGRLDGCSWVYFLSKQPSRAVLRTVCEAPAGRVTLSLGQGRPKLTCRSMPSGAVCEDRLQTSGTLFRHSPNREKHIPIHARTKTA